MKHPFLEELSALLEKYQAELHIDYMPKGFGGGADMEFEIITPEEVICIYEGNFIDAKIIKNMEE